MCVNTDLCAGVRAGEAYRVAGRGQRPPDERPGAAEGALQPADPQRHLPHQPHQAADHRERRVQEQQQLLGRRPTGWGERGPTTPRWGPAAGKHADGADGAEPGPTEVTSIQGNPGRTTKQPPTYTHTHAPPTAVDAPSSGTSPSEAHSNSSHFISDPRPKNQI